MTTTHLRTTSLSDVLLDKLRAAWRRPDLCVDAQPAGEGVTVSIRPRRPPPGQYTYAVERHLAAQELVSSLLDDLVDGIVQDMDTLPVLEEAKG
ncbi:MAG TPA: hypothetical protein VJ578_03620 [Dehalococcoidia bacterium]|nr:hypothetical protein [Dehalococcoidia bacterium]